MSTPNDLLIIGAGDLGCRVAQLWREKHPVAEILGETRTATSHDTLSAVGITPIVSGTPTRAFPNVVFCAPPSPASDYAGAVTAATRRVARGGRLVFTSSTGVHGDATAIDERAPQSENTARAARLLHAENAALGAPCGVVLRLTGLYHLGRGPHMFCLSRDVMPGSEGSTINMIHYNDAASAVVRALLVDELTERTFLAAGEQVMSVGEIVDNALRHPRFEGRQRPRFLNDEPARVKRYENSSSRAALGWKPRFETFADFVDEELRTIQEVCVET